MSDSAFIHKEAFWLLCGAQIGRGMSRVVYQSKLNPGHVIKTEEDAGRFQNVIEWETWQRVKGTPVERWFAPCVEISQCGAILIMEKTERPAERQFLDRMPAFLCDFKRTNYGLYKGRLVCHDYGPALLFEHGMTKRMRKAHWWDA